VFGAAAGWESDMMVGAGGAAPGLPGRAAAEARTKTVF